jgi:hypothetical protein
MGALVAAGSENGTSFAIINFTNLAAPTKVLVDPGFGSGCRVAIDGTRVAVGAVLSGHMRIVDASNPAAPVQQTVLPTILGGVGAIAIQGNFVALGEMTNTFQARIALIDVSNPAAPSLVATASTPLATGATPPAIGSLAFTGPMVVVASGSSDFECVQVNFVTSPPTVTPFNPVLAGPPSLDADASHIVVGDSTSGIVKVLDPISHAAIGGSVNTTLSAITSVATSGATALAAGQFDTRISRLAIAAATSSSLFDPGFGGPSTVGIDGSRGVAGEILGSRVKLIDVTASPPSILSTIDTTLASISTIDINESGATGASGPLVSAMPASLAFGPVLVGSMSSLTVAIKNTGGSPLHLSTIQSNDAAHFVVTSGGGLATVAAGGTHNVTVRFQPSAEMSYSQALTMSTDDPAHPSFSVALTGVGGRPHISVTPNDLDFGNVAVCLPGSLSVGIHNSGAVPLHVSSIASDSGLFTVPPSSLTVAANSTAMVSVTFRPTAVGPANATLTISSDDTANPSVVVTAHGNGTPTPPPSISIDRTVLHFGDVPTQFFIGLRVTISNTGPCQPLDVTLTTTTTSSADRLFLVTDSDPLDVPPGSTTVSGTIAHNGSERFVVVFAPLNPGAATGALTIASNDPAHPNTVIPLDGTGVVLAPTALELVLDRSGSMASPVAGGGTRMDALKTAVHVFADLLVAASGDELGAVEFDDAVSVMTPLGTYDGTQRVALETATDALTPRNFTSIGGGLQRAGTELAGSALGRKVILVFTDGLENTPPTIASAEPPLLAAGTEIYAIGLGEPQNISTVALSQLAASSNGHYFQTDDGLILRKNFVQVLADAFRHNMAADPVHDLPVGTWTELPVEITGCERRISFVLNHDDLAAAVDFEVVAPNGMVFGPNAPFTNRLVTHRSRPGYQYYQIACPPLDPGSGSVLGPPQIGTWTMRIRPRSAASASLRCVTNVMVESDLQLQVRVPSTSVSSPLVAQASILHEGMPVTDAHVVLRLTAPTRSLAAVSTPAVIHRALQADRHLLPLAKRSLIGSRTSTHQLKRLREGLYGTKLEPPKIDGVYRFEFHAKGRACGGTFERYAELSLFIGKRADPKRSQIETREESGGILSVRLTPKDAAGEALGPGYASLISAKPRGVSSVSRVVDYGDGSYGLLLQPSTVGKPPTGTLSIGDTALHLPPPAPPGRTRAKRGERQKRQE